MGSGAPQGVTGDVLRDGGEPSRGVTADRSFWTKGAIMPPLLGSIGNATRARVYWSGVESFQVELGNFNHSTQVWTDEKGIEALIGDLQAALVRARIAREQA